MDNYPMFQSIFNWKSLKKLGLSCPATNQREFQSIFNWKSLKKSNSTVLEASEGECFNPSSIGKALKSYFPSGCGSIGRTFQSIFNWKSLKKVGQLFDLYVKIKFQSIFNWKSLKKNVSVG